MKRDIERLCQADHPLSPLRRLIRDKHCEGETGRIASAALHGDIIPLDIDALEGDSLCGERHGCVAIPLDFHTEGACEMIQVIRYLVHGLELGRSDRPRRRRVPMRNGISSRCDPLNYQHRAARTRRYRTRLVRASRHVAACWARGS